MKRGRFKLPILIFFVFGGLFAVFFRQPKPPQPLTEVLRSDLVTSNGAVYLKGAGTPFTGVMIEKYPDGQLQSRSVLSNGVLNGISEGWYTNGVKQVEEHFVGGVSDGLRTKWYPDGKKMSEATIVSGKIDGTFRRWHETGELAEEVHMAAGQPDGVSLSFYPSGFVKGRATMKAGKVVDQKFWKEGEEQPPAKAPH